MTREVGSIQNHNEKEDDMRMAIMLTLVGISALSGGCATITSSEMQQLALTAKEESGAVLEGAKCTLRNDKGSWEGTTPGFVNVRRSAEDLNVECRKDGQKDGLLKAISRAAGGMFGNIVFGGGIGAIIDHNKGTGYNYPDALPVEMGKSVVVDRRNPAPAQSADAGTQAPR